MINYTNVNNLDMFLEDNFDVVVRKNTTSKRAFRVALLRNKESMPAFRNLSRKFGAVHGVHYGLEYKGFLLEEIEYVETRPKKTAQEMQAEFLKKNAPKKVEDGGIELSDIERISKGNRDDPRLETQYETKYDGVECYNAYNVKILIKHRRTISGQEAGRKKNMANITYYSVDTGYGRRTVRESTLEKFFKSGKLSIEPKHNPFYTEDSFREDDGFWDEDNFN